MIVDWLGLSAAVIIHSISKTLHGVYILLTNIKDDFQKLVDFITSEKLSLQKNTCWKSKIKRVEKKSMVIVLVI